MSNEITVTIKATDVPLQHWYDLSDDLQHEFDYIDEDDKTSCRFFEHNGSFWDVGDFIKTDCVAGWEAAYPLNAFAQLAIRLTNDNEAVDVALLH